MKKNQIDGSRRKVLGALAAAPVAWLTGCGAGEESGERLESESSALTGAELQALCNAFYAMSNRIDIRISMNPASWDALRTAQPNGGICNWDFPPDQDRFATFEADSVTVSGSAFSSSIPTIQRVGIQKKSFCGSFHTVTPCLKLDFGEFIGSNEALIESFLGTSHLLLNNCLQDPSFIRQPLAYYLFKQAGLPYSRGNFARVFVNNALIGVYLNLEPIRKRHIENNFGRSTGNLYEFELTDDFTSSRMAFIDVEKVHAFTNKVDLSKTASELAVLGLNGVNRNFDVNQFIKFHAMEFLLKHWDSYDGGVAGRGNNTYVYNDVLDPAAERRFKFIPWGTDAILRPERKFGIEDPSRSSIVGGLVRGNATTAGQLRAQIATYANTVFSRANLEGPIKQFIDQMQSTLATLGAVPIDTGFPNVPANIAEVRQQLGLVRSAAFVLAGISSPSYYLKDPNTGDCMRASATQHFPSNSTTDFEVVHRAPVPDANDRWTFDGASFTNEASQGHLRCSASLSAAPGHLAVYTTPTPDTGDGRQTFRIYADMPNSFCVSGTFKLRNDGTGQFLKFATDAPSGTGAQRVYQTSQADASNLVIY